MAADALSADQKIELINLNLQEVLRPDIVDDVIRRQDRPLRIYWGTATTGRPHCGYFVPMVKIAHFLRAGCHVKILLADIHAFLDNMKAPIDTVDVRARYYRLVITSMLKAIFVPTGNHLEFVLGKSYQLSAEYVMDLFKLSSVVTEHDAKRAGAEVVKHDENAKLSGLLYPLMQALDEEHLDVDVQFGGADQRKIFVLASEHLPKIGYKVRGHLMNPMVPGLAGGKMSSSDLQSKIDILDSPEAVKKKISKAYAAPRIVEGNGLISFIEYVLLPISVLQHGKGQFTAKAQGKETLVYEDIATLKEDYLSDKLTPQLLKSSLIEALNTLLEPIQAEYQASKEWQDIDEEAYANAEPPKKQKKTMGYGR